MSLLLQGAGAAGVGVIAGIGPTAWYDLSGIGLADGVASSSVPNLGSVGGSIVQAVGAKQPVAKTGANGINSLGVLRGDGVNDFMMQTFAMTSPATWFIVARHVAAYVAADGVMDGATGFNLLTRQPNTGAIGLYGGGAIQGGSGITTLSPHVYTMVFGTVGSGVNTEFWVDGTQILSTPLNNSDAGGCTLFAQFGGVGSWSNVDIGEVAGFDTPPTLAQGNAIRAALKAKWGTP